MLEENFISRIFNLSLFFCFLSFQVSIEVCNRNTLHQLALDLIHNQRFNCTVSYPIITTCGGSLPCDKKKKRLVEPSLG